MARRLLPTVCVQLLLLALLQGAGAQLDYTSSGPCSVSTIKYAGDVIMPASSGCSGKQCRLKVTVTLPAETQQAAGCPAGPYPLVAFFSGFSVSGQGCAAAVCRSMPQMQ